ncbi:TPA: phosphate uptake regulator PhoU [Candidatus Woesearchaeota archaeon]|nr:phosphate uptake regulator PhoU [Candidatus Woesearchaeota archaeon]
MQRRKIQLIAGTTYTVSLPKEWITKNNLKAKSEIVINEKQDNTLQIALGLPKEKKISSISVEVDEHIHNLSQILLTAYYMGIENITLFSKKELSKEVKAKIRRTISYMSGTEIQYEDKQKITIRVLLDITKVDIMQVLYRIFLIIDSSLSNLIDAPDITEIKLNENEIDRLYHLIAKIISLSLTNPELLHSSGIKDLSLIPQYFLISKRLENIADEIEKIALHLSKKNIEASQKKKILSFIKQEIGKEAVFLKSTPLSSFMKLSEDQLETIKSSISKLKNQLIAEHLEDIVRYIVDIEEELANMFFYRQIIDGKM